MEVLPRPVTMMIWSQPAAMASSTPYWMIGLSTSGSISLGCALVAGRKRVPNPAAGKTALRTLIFMQSSSINVRCRNQHSAVSNQQSVTAISHQQTPFTAKDAKNAKRNKTAKGKRADPCELAAALHKH